MVTLLTIKLYNYKHRLGSQDQLLGVKYLMSFHIWNGSTKDTASWEICRQVRKQQLELHMEQQTGSKLGKEYVKAVYCHPAYLTYMQNTSWEMLG